jgi:hypothetical protein
MSKAILDNASKGNLAGTVLSCLLLPNTDVGNIAINPLQDNPLSTTTFQFGQGSTGWYFLYGTFIVDASTNPPQVGNFFAYIFRVETIPDKLREQLKLAPGTSTYYNLVGGVGINGVWYKTPYIMTRGTYQVMTETTFNFTALDLPAGYAYSFSSLATGQFSINVQWVDPVSNKPVGFSAYLNSVRPPFYAGDKGCSPCVQGAGSLYWSYTQMTVDASLTIPGTDPKTYSNGTGWIDHEWLNTNIDGVSSNILANILAMFSGASRGLGEYLWINLHVTPNLQYMITALPKIALSVDSEIPMTVNRYANTTTWGLKGSLVVKKVKGILDPGLNVTVNFPTAYQIIIPGKFGGLIGGSDVLPEEYYIDTTPFGDNVTIDLNNNLHWDGSALLYDSTQKLIPGGSAFSEVNKVIDIANYNRNILSIIGLDPTPSNIQMLSGGKLPFIQGLFSLAIVISMIILFIIFLVYTYKMFKTLRDSN